MTLNVPNFQGTTIAIPGVIDFDVLVEGVGALATHPGMIVRLGNVRHALSLELSAKDTQAAGFETRQVWRVTMVRQRQPEPIVDGDTGIS